MRTILLIIAFLGVCRPASGLANSRENVVLVFHDGRQVQGELAGVESGERIWLISREAGIELRSGYSLDKVARVLSQGQDLSLTRVTTQRNQTSPWKLPIQEIPLPKPRQVTLEHPTVRAQSLEVTAEFANWDDDAAPDGVRLYLTARDVWGQPVPVSGQ
ncbi:MAG: hypothetical protein KDA84_26125, partial [Planctomycetaceae bacterium]|nr:hypothetical protein [Planctomycetaceae bacterium]